MAKRRKKVGDKCPKILFHGFDNLHAMLYRVLRDKTNEMTSGLLQTLSRHDIDNLKSEIMKSNQKIIRDMIRSFGGKRPTEELCDAKVAKAYRTAVGEMERLTKTKIRSCADFD